MTSVPKNVHIDKLHDTINKCNNTYQSTIKIKPVGVKLRAYIDFNKENNEKDLKFKIRYHLRISKYKNIFSKGYTPNLPKEAFVIKKS